ncbi:hypothetical protein [Arenimonas metalli]|uniref:Uncharacterized protein n=1 Tax=Arenimonas metalli CF5-1 TaxID=1384056 RepID=A0A091AXU1_9GAMM|nr:hypothetical protein [Arenimonas metalli]KFN45148.1 hypothetical protein N787_03200 [Arenimonas metalli CF5-1]
MTSLKKFTLAMLLGLALSAAAQGQSANSIPLDTRVMSCLYIQNPSPLRTVSEIECHDDGVFTLKELYEAGWKIAHYSAATEKSSIYHQFILERK